MLYYFSAIHVAAKQEHEHYIDVQVLEQEQKQHFKFLTLIPLCVWVLIGVTLLMISCFSIDFKMPAYLKWVQ